MMFIGDHIDDNIDEIKKNSASYLANISIFKIARKAFMSFFGIVLPYFYGLLELVRRC
jgi:hypothetical protein